MLQDPISPQDEANVLCLHKLASVWSNSVKSCVIGKLKNQVNLFLEVLKSFI